MPQLLQIAQLGHTTLRTPAKAITNISDPVVQQLIDDMLATVMEVDGVGLAAPQVYQSLSIFIMASHPNARYPYAPEMPPTAIINPEIVTHSEITEKDWEGCLSIPGIRALVPRWKSVDVRYHTRDGQKIETTYEDFQARIFQHEFDHLQGKVFFDRLDDAKDIYTEKEFLKIIAQKLKSPPPLAQRRA